MSFNSSQENGSQVSREAVKTNRAFLLKLRRKLAPFQSLSRNISAEDTILLHKVLSEIDKVVNISSYESSNTIEIIDPKKAFAAAIKDAKESIVSEYDRVLRNEKVLIEDLTPLYKILYENDEIERALESLRVVFAVTQKSNKDRLPLQKKKALIHEELKNSRSVFLDKGLNYSQNPWYFIIDAVDTLTALIKRDPENERLRKLLALATRIQAIEEDNYAGIEIRYRKKIFQKLSRAMVAALVGLGVGVGVVSFTTHDANAEYPTLPQPSISSPTPDSPVTEIPPTDLPTQRVAPTASSPTAEPTRIVIPPTDLEPNLPATAIVVPTRTLETSTPPASLVPLASPSPTESPMQEEFREDIEHTDLTRLDRNFMQLQEYARVGIEWLGNSVDARALPSLEEIQTLAENVGYAYGSGYPSTPDGSRSVQINRFVYFAFLSADNSASYSGVVFERNPEGVFIATAVFPFGFSNDDTSTGVNRTFESFHAPIRQLVRDANGYQYLVLGDGRNAAGNRALIDANDEFFYTNGGGYSERRNDDHRGSRIILTTDILGFIAGQNPAQTSVAVNLGYGASVTGMDTGIPGVRGNESRYVFPSNDDGLRQNLRTIRERSSPEPERDLFQSIPLEGASGFSVESAAEIDTTFQLSQTYYDRLWQLNTRIPTTEISGPIPSDLAEAIANAVEQGSARINELGLSPDQVSAMLYAISYRESRWNLHNGTDDNGVAAGYFQLTYRQESNGNNPRLPSLNEAVTPTTAAMLALNHLLRSYANNPDWIRVAAEYHGGNNPRFISYVYAFQVVSGAQGRLENWRSSNRFAPNPDYRQELLNRPLSGMRDFVFDHPELFADLSQPIQFSTFSERTGIGSELRTSISSLNLLTYEDIIERFADGTVSSPTNPPLEVNQRFNNPSSRYESGFHNGVDWSADEGDEIRFPFDGFRLVYNGPDTVSDNGGNGPNTQIFESKKGINHVLDSVPGQVFFTVIIGHSDTTIAEMNAAGLDILDEVVSGQAVSTVGDATMGNSTGAHIHITLALSFHSNEDIASGKLPTGDILIDWNKTVAFDPAPFFSPFIGVDFAAIRQDQPPTFDESTGNLNEEVLGHFLDLHENTPIPLPRFLIFSDWDVAEQADFLAYLSTQIQSNEPAMGRGARYGRRSELEDTLASTSGGTLSETADWLRATSAIPNTNNEWTFALLDFSNNELLTLEEYLNRYREVVQDLLGRQIMPVFFLLPEGSPRADEINDGLRQFAQQYDLPLFNTDTRNNNGFIEAMDALARFSVSALTAVDILP